jgi:hypothetical protein
MVRFLLDHLSTPVLGVCVVGAVVGASLLGLALVRRSVELSTLESHKDVAGFILAVVGVLYAVLLGFVAIDVWQQFNDATTHADQEAAEVDNLYRLGVGLDRQGDQLRPAVVRYATSVANVEWPRMAAHQEESHATDLALNNLWHATTAVRPKNAAQAGFLLQSTSDLDTASQLRRTRIANSDSTLPGPLWIALILGAVITVGFTYFFGLKRFAPQVLMVAALSAMIGVTLFVIISLDLPYTGDVAVKPVAMQQAIKDFGRAR